MRKVKVFVSSPGDLAAERKRLQDVVVRMNGEYVGLAQIELFLWEESFYTASRSYQDQIPPTAGSDIVISMFWTRLGAPLGADFRGRSTPKQAFVGELTGSTYELLTALDAVEDGTPAVYVFRKTQKPSFELSDDGDDDDYVRARAEWRKVGAFFKANFTEDAQRGLVPYDSFETVDDFETRVAAILHNWIDTNIASSRQPLWPARRGSPFPGLVAYDLAHADVYFGRAQKVANAVRKLKDKAEHGFPMLFIVGQSGAGKSSLMRAGLAPRLTTPGAVDGVDIWRIATIRPGGDVSPFHALAKALIGDPAAPAGDPTASGAMPELRSGAFATVELLAAQLAPGTPASIAPILAELDVLARARKAKENFHRDIGANLLLLVDQFEDVFGETFSTPKSEFAKFLDICAASRRIWVVATLRADLYDRFINDFIVLKDKAASYDVTPPREAELAEIIEKSAAAAGLTYETDPQSGRGLDEVLFEDARDTGSLPLLQFALNRLYEECVLKRAAVDGESEAPRLFTFSAYRELGGIAGAVDIAAEEAIAKAGIEDEKLLRRTFERLLRLLVIQVVDRRSDAVGREAFAVRPVTVAALPFDPETRKLVDALVAARILVTDGIETRDAASGATGSATLRIAHERVLESWQRAQRFLAAEKAFFQTRSDVESQHLIWKRARKSGELIPLGNSLRAAAELGRSYGEELPGELRDFIARSIRRGRMWNALYWVVAAVLVVATGAATWFGIRSAENATIAEQNYTVARTQVDTLIQQIANQLENTYGLRTDTITAILSVVQGSIERLAESNPDPALERSRGEMLYRFARIYRKAGQNDQQGGQKGLAETYAAASFEIRKTLVGQSPGDDQLQGDLGDSHELLGDIYRDQVFRLADDADRAKLNLARSEQQAAFDIRQKLRQRDPANRRWRFGLSYSYVRLGDLDQAFTGGKDLAEVRPKLEASLARYLDAAKLADAMKADFVGDAEVGKEVAFTAQKVGDGQGRLEQWHLARAAYERSACIRTIFFRAETENAKVKDDYAFILGKISKIPGLEGEYAQALAFKSLVTRRALFDSDPSNANWTLFLADTLSSVASIKLERETLAAFWFRFEARDKIAFLHKRYPTERNEKRLADAERQLDEARTKLREQGVVFSENRDQIYDRVAGEEVKYAGIFDSKYAARFAGSCEAASSLPEVAGGTP